MKPDNIVILIVLSGDCVLSKMGHKLTDRIINLSPNNQKQITVQKNSHLVV